LWHERLLLPPYPVENNYGGYIFFQNTDDFEAAVQCEQL
jgi:hypothetical protein